jgi:hypothetical protein
MSQSGSCAEEDNADRQQPQVWNGGPGDGQQHDHDRRGRESRLCLDELNEKGQERSGQADPGDHDLADGADHSRPAQWTQTVIKKRYPA